MAQEQMSMTFKINIEQRMFYTWQGTLEVNGQRIPFKSEMELLRAMNKLLPPSVILVCARENH